MGRLSAGPGAQGQGRPRKHALDRGMEGGGCSEKGFLSGEGVTPENGAGGKIQKDRLHRSSSQGWAPEDLGSRPCVLDRTLPAACGYISLWQPGFVLI